MRKDSVASRASWAATLLRDLVGEGIDSPDMVKAVMGQLLPEFRIIPDRAFPLYIQGAKEQRNPGEQLTTFQLNGAEMKGNPLFPDAEGNPSDLTLFLHIETTIGNEFEQWEERTITVPADVAWFRKWQGK